MEFRSVVVQLVLVLILLQAVLMAHIVSLLVDLFSGFTDDMTSGFQAMRSVCFDTVHI